jgi:hypothetical protein
MLARYDRPIVGLAVALVLAGTVIVPRIAGVDTWKIVLAAIGLGLIVASGRAPRAK